MADTIIPNVVVSMPSQLFTLARSFKAAANGKIYIGKIDTDPTIPENQIQVYVQNEDDSLVPIAQPININTGGYPVYGGQISKFVTVEGHSMAVYDALNVQQFYFSNVLRYDPDQLRQQLSAPGGDKLVGSTFYGSVYDSYLPSLYRRNGNMGNGLTITSRRQAFFYAADGFYYTYSGTLPHNAVETAPTAEYICVGLLNGADVNTPENFGAVGDGVADDTKAVQLLFNSKLAHMKASGTYKLANQARSSGGYDSYMAYNYVLRINGFAGTMDLTQATLIMPGGVPRITAIDILNSTGSIKLPKIIGNMQQTSMPSMYIDDCAVRIGANCNNLSIFSPGIDHYPGHGIVVRHYIQDGLPTLDEGIPYDITIVAKLMRHCWQSGIVPITGDTIRIRDFDVQYSGSLENLNGQVATVGHNIHTESVAGAGGANNRLRNIWVQDGNGFNARMHGIMAHTAIDNLNVMNNNFRFNGLDGGRFEAAAHKINSYGNHYSNNGGRGVTFNCGSLFAFGYPLLQHAASFNDVIENNGADGFTDLSGSKALVVSGNIGLNAGNGITLQEGGEQSLSNLNIYNNGKGATETKYAINGGASSYSNVRIYNSAPEVNIQRAFNFRAPGRLTNVIVDANSTTFDVLDGNPRNVPANDGLIRLSGTFGTIIGRRMLVNPKGAGGWLMPDTFDYIGISFTASADMFFPNPSSRNLFAQFSLELLTGSVTATVKVQTGTVNGTTQFAVSAGHVYTLRYTTLTNLQVTQIS
ncbi:phage head-binding domain-containing protein [Serratia fonticola]|uniref:phage head-binding domain-containing protein n=1 Tax=Serratia fonticola TaxID=47917 RepID=UPI001FD84AB3|nr:phage head-binding domain-containing protein [Serratia fonticola]